MTHENKHQQKFAKALLRQLDEKYVFKVRIVLFVIVFVVFFILGVLNRYDFPLLIIPKMFGSIVMGICLAYAISLRNIKYLVKYIDVQALKSDADGSTENNLPKFKYQVQPQATDK